MYIACMKEIAIAACRYLINEVDIDNFYCKRNQYILKECDEWANINLMIYKYFDTHC